MPPPDRWEVYSKVGNVIPGTRFICFKTPLKQALQSKLQDDMRFSPDILVSIVQEKAQELGLIIDLTFTSKYYFKEDFTNQGIYHLKIPTYGQQIPHEDVVKRFFDAVETMTAENSENEKLIGVHCTHGVNRTGYLVCRYMIEILAFSPEEALEAFRIARGHSVERQNYIDDLLKCRHNPDYKNEGRHQLPQKLNKPGNFSRHGKHHGHSLPETSHESSHCSYWEPSGSGYNGVSEQFQAMASRTYSQDKNNHGYGRQNSDSARHHPYRENPGVFDSQDMRQSQRIHRGNGRPRDYSHCDNTANWRDRSSSHDYSGQGFQSRGYHGDHRRQYNARNHDQYNNYHRDGGRGSFQGNRGRGFSGSYRQGQYRHSERDSFDNSDNDRSWRQNHRTRGNYKNSFSQERTNHYHGDRAPKSNSQRYSNFNRDYSYREEKN